MNKGTKKKSKFYIIVLTTFIIIIVYYVFFYRVADGIKIKPYENIEEYTVYNGRESFEYWKTTLNTNQQILYEEMKEAYLRFLDSFSTDINVNI